jgi:hypothetical protein
MEPTDSLPLRAPTTGVRRPARASTTDRPRAASGLDRPGEKTKQPSNASAGVAVSALENRVMLLSEPFLEHTLIAARILTVVHFRPER